MKHGKKRKDHIRPPLGGRPVMGRNCLRELLRHCPERLLRVFTLRSGDREWQALVQELERRTVPLEFTDQPRLQELTAADSHQGFVALVADEPLDLRAFLDASQESPRSTVLMLDGIEDPHNLGACLRAAECFGVAAAVRSRNRGSPLTAVASKASAGASELVPWIEVANLSQALKQFKEHGFWIAAADVGAGSVAIGDFEPPPKLVLILGAEGAGVHKLLLDQADYRIKIPLFGRIDSLNVSQAAAVLLFALTSGDDRSPVY